MTTRVLSPTPNSPNVYFKWIVANALAELVGLGMVALLAVLLMPRLETGITFGLASLLFVAVLFEGLCVAVAQWFVLRHYVKRGAWWIAANALAWAVGMMIIFATTDVLAFIPSMVLATASVVLALLLTGAVVGAVHGSVLVWLLRKGVNNVSS